MKHLALLALCLAAQGAVAAEPVGWMRDGSGYFPDCDPPTSWDVDKGVNLRWKARLPNWSNSSPIVVAPAGGQGPPRVFVLSEPLDYSPIFQCLDADTGKELWRSELDAVASFPPQEQAEARQLAKQCWAGLRQMMLLSSRMNEFHQAHAKNFNGTDPDATVKAEWDKFLAEAGALDLSFAGFRLGAGGYPKLLSIKKGGPADERDKRLKKLGLSWSQWFYEGTWDGIAYPTPCSDGERVYTITSHNLYSAFDLDGKVVWTRRFPIPDGRNPPPEHKARLTPTTGRGSWPFGWPGQGNFSTSPLLSGGRLISMAGAYIRCLEATTGKTLWEYPLRANIGQNMAVPAVVALGQERVVVVPGGENRCGPEGDDVIRLRDGKILGVLPGTSSVKCGFTGPIVDRDVVIHLQDGKLTASRLKLAANGDRLEAEVLWQTESSKRTFGTWRTAVRDGLLYNEGAVFDARAGRVVAERLPCARGGYCGGGNVIIGDYFLSCGHNQGQFVFRDIRTNKLLGDNQFPRDPPDGASLDQKRTQEHLDHWRRFGAATPFAWKDRLYIRGFDFLYCLGKPKQP